jgi:O-antigen ligase
VQPELAFAQLPTAIGLLILYLVVSSYEFKKSEFDTIKLYAIGGGTVAAIMTIYQYIQNPNLRATLTGRTDQNFAAFTFLIPFAVSTSMIFGQNKIMKQALCWIISVVIFFAIIVTGSRGCFLGAVIAVLINMLYVKKTIKQRMIIVIMITIAGFIFLSYSPDFFSERWGEAIETGGAHRLDIWYLGYKSLEKYWAFGVGMNNFSIATKEFGHHLTYYDPTSGAHNLYLESIVQLGIIGFTLMIIAMVKHYQVLRSRFNEYPIDMIMLKASFGGVLVASIFLHTFLTKSFWLLWMMIMMYKNISKNKLSN